MRNVLVIVLLVSGVVTAAFGQKTSKNNYTGAWENSSSWTTSPAPDGTLNTELDVTINGYITRNGNLSVEGSYLTQNFVINDTLVILGNVTFPNDAAELVIGPNGVLIVIGSINFGNNTIVTNDGIFAVSGSITFAPGLSDIYSGSGELFVQGAVTANTVAQTADNWDNLDTLYPPIYEFIQCGGGSACALPVKLAYFHVVLRNDIVELRWATIMEEDFQKFVIQRSATGTIYEDIGELSGQGFNIYEIETKYLFIDKMPLIGMNYYRLKAVDLDDTYEYFNVKMVRVEGDRTIAIYPNPSAGESLSFQFNFKPQETDRIVLIDQLGSEIFSANGSTSLKEIFFVNKLRPGIYTLCYLSEGFKRTEKIVIQQ